MSPELLPAPPRAEGYLNVPVGVTLDRTLRDFDHGLYVNLLRLRHNETFVAVEIDELREAQRYKERRPSAKRIEASLRLLIEQQWIIPSLSVHGGKRMYRVTGGTQAKLDAALAIIEGVKRSQKEPIRVGRRKKKAIQ